MTARDAVAGLVERFASHREAYRSGAYNEAQLREEFLNPFFEALGWDVYNKKGYADDPTDPISRVTTSRSTGWCTSCTG